MSKVEKTGTTGKAFRRFLVFLCVMGVIFGVCYEFYNTHSTETVTVVSITTQQRISGDNESFSTNYEYIVSTDCGLYKITPSGVFASQSFGQIQEGKWYTIEAVGFSVPLINVYPFIIRAKGVEE